MGRLLGMGDISIRETGGTPGSRRGWIAGRRVLGFEGFEGDLLLRERDALAPGPRGDVRGDEMRP